jgi:hypothetical protein
VRTGGQNWSCTGGPCLRYVNEGQEVHLERVATTFGLSATPAAVRPNIDTVTFEIRWSPDSMGAFEVPFKIDSIIWLKIDGTKDPFGGPCWWNHFASAGKGILRCKRVLAKSGTMKVWATVNGDTESMSAHVSVVPCLLGDTVRDDARIRRKLAEAWAASSAFGPVSQRVERAGARIRRADGSVFDTNFGSLPGANNCRAWDPNQWNPVQAVTSIGTIVLLWHTHVFLPWPAASDPSPNCAGLPLAAGQFTLAFPGFSSADSGQPVPQLVIDKANSYYSADPSIFPIHVQEVPKAVCDLLGYN